LANGSRAWLPKASFRELWGVLGTSF
jgi:hypothetical protein